jgi:hypothetical protein
MKNDTPFPEGGAFGNALADVSMAMLNYLRATDPADYAYIFEAIGNGAMMTLTTNWTIDCAGDTVMSVRIGGKVHEVGSMSPAPI